MPSTFFGLNIGATGLFTYQTALNTTSHNIVNTETKGYTRQVVNQKAGMPISVNNTYGMVGTGVDVTGITQVRNDYYDLKYRKSNTIYGAYAAKQYFMNEIENYFNEVSLDGFTTSFNKFFDSLQELSKNPGGLTERTAVTSYAQSLTEYFNSMATSLKSVQEECNFEVKNQVDKINSLGQQIATLTKQINVLEVNGGTANDLRDQRQVLLDELSYIVNITYDEQVVGDGVGVTSFTVKIDGQTLVSNDEYNTLKVVPRENKLNQNDADGLYDIVWSNGNTFSTQSASLSGYLKSLIEIRDGNNNENLQSSSGTIDPDKANVLILTQTNINSIEKLNIPEKGVITIGNEEYAYSGFTVKYDTDSKTCEYTFTFEKDLPDDIVKNISSKKISIGNSIDYKGIPYYMGRLNELVRTFSKEFNTLHKSGEDLDGEQGKDFFAANREGTKTGFTEYEDYYKLTAANFIVSETISGDPRKLVTGSATENGVEKKDILEKLIALKSDVSMFKQGTPASYFQKLVAEVGTDAKKADDFTENQSDILKMIQKQRLSVSGVDANEEAMNMIKYQYAYNLSAKVIQIMNEIYDKLINGTGI
ncbi:MAG: Flagellar hook-associated protein 1 [Lachnoclostridium sp.]|jgi:flagellar hook-associated protein 1